MQTVSFSDISAGGRITEVAVRTIVPCNILIWSTCLNIIMWFCICPSSCGTIGCRWALSALFSSIKLIVSSVYALYQSSEDHTRYGFDLSLTWDALFHPLSRIQPNLRLPRATFQVTISIVFSNLTIFAIVRYIVWFCFEAVSCLATWIAFGWWYLSAEYTFATGYVSLLPHVNPLPCHVCSSWNV
jgi:hypothetical protein